MPDFLRSPLSLGIITAIVEVLVLAWLYESRRRPALIAAIAIPVIGGAVVLYTLLHVTDRDRVDRVIADIRRAALEGRVQDILAHVDPDCTFDDGDRASLERQMTFAFRAVSLTSVRVTKREFLSVTPVSISVRLTANVTGVGPFNYTRSARTVWQLTFIPRGRTWVIAEIHLLSSDRPELGGRLSAP